MKYTKEEMDRVADKIVVLLTEKEEMRIGKIAKVLIHQGFVESSYEVDKYLNIEKIYL